MNEVLYKNYIQCNSNVNCSKLNEMYFICNHYDILKRFAERKVN